MLGGRMRPWRGRVLKRILARLAGAFTIEVEVREIGGRPMLCTTYLNRSFEPVYSEMVEVSP